MNVTDAHMTERLRVERLAVETLYRAFNDKDPNLVDGVLASNWEDIPLAPGQGPGPDGLKQVIGLLGNAFPDVTVTIHELIQVPGRIAVRAEITGTHHGEFFGIAASGKRVSFRLHEFHALEGERVTTTWHMEDLFGLFQQLGQFPPGEA